MSALIDAATIRHSFIQEVSDPKPAAHTLSTEERVVVEQRQQDLSSSLPPAESSHAPSSSEHSPQFVAANDVDRGGNATPPLQTEPTETMRRVFDVAPLNVMNKARRTAITVLIIVSNLVQVGSPLEI